MSDKIDTLPPTLPAEPAASARASGLWIAFALILLAAIIRIPGFDYTGDHLNPYFAASEAMVILAYIYAADWMIAAFDGASGLVRLEYDKRFGMCAQAYIPMMVACLTLAAGTDILTEIDGNRIFLRGIDGMAFDQMTDAGRIYSALLAGCLVLFIIERGQRSALSLRRLAVILFSHAPFLALGVGLASLFLFALTGLQAGARGEVMGLIHSLDSVVAKNLTIALYAGGFACVRLLAVVAIFTAVLRISYRRRAAAA